MKDPRDFCLDLIRTTQAEAQANGLEPAEAVMHLLIAAATITAAQHPVRSTEETLAAALRYAVQSQQGWFPTPRYS
jgi:hypothetical protein